MTASAKQLNAFKKVKNELVKELKKRTSHVFPNVVDKNSPRYNELHPSSYPFCGLQQAYSEAKNLPPKPFDYFGEFHTSVGTTTHELIQKFMGYKGKVIGHWKCLKCKKTHKSSKPCVAPKECRTCGFDVFEYLEIGIKYKKYTRGHLDGIIKLNGRYYIIDYKSTSPKKNKQHRQYGGVYPYKKNVAQIESYIFYVEEEYGIEIDGWFLIYLSRDDNVKDMVIEGALVSDSDKVKLKKKLNIYEKQFSKVMKLRKKSKPEYWKYLIKTKPCDSMSEYKDKMHSYDMCPLAVNGTCFNKSKLKREIDNLTSKIKLVNEL